MSADAGAILQRPWNCHVIFIGIGSNLSSGSGTPAQTCRQALDRLQQQGVRILALSRFYESAPVPVSDQPWFVNAVAALDTDLAAGELLALMHQVEAAFGRQRRVVNEARTLDMDLIDYNGVCQVGPPILPHPRAAERAFVLLPLRELAPDWRDPVSGRSIDDLIAHLPPGQLIRPLDGE
nr:2-amino-4-hydroxy-6-hydroxymethyldihydropteridine diphosphokinase [Niveispirillum sp. BGYR6]